MKSGKAVVLLLGLPMFFYLFHVFAGSEHLDAANVTLVASVAYFLLVM